MGFSARFTAPSYVNKYYIKTWYGGLNKCILIDKSSKSCLPNCVGYAYGSFMEVAGKTECDLPTCNAEDWYASVKGIYDRGPNPKLGAVICWGSGIPWNSYDGCGHVGIVMGINRDRSITVAQSNYGGERFVISTVPYPYGIYGQYFQGFIYNPWTAAIPTTDWIDNMYGSVLGRAPDATGRRNWISRAEDGVRGKNMVEGFFNSAEYRKKNTSDREFVQSCYRGILTRYGSEPEIKHYTDRLAAGATRQQILNSFTGSAEFLNVCNCYGIAW